MDGMTTTETRTIPDDLRDTLATLGDLYAMFAGQIEKLGELTIPALRRYWALDLYSLRDSEAMDRYVEESGAGRLFDAMDRIRRAIEDQEHQEREGQS